MKQYKVVGQGGFFFPLLRMSGRTGDILSVPENKAKYAEVYGDKLERLEAKPNHKKDSGGK